MVSRPVGFPVTGPDDDAFIVMLLLLVASVVSAIGVSGAGRDCSPKGLCWTIGHVRAAGADIDAVPPSCPRHHAPLPLPALAESEFSVDDVEPRESTAEPWDVASVSQIPAIGLQPCESRHARGWLGFRVSSDSLSRLCRLNC